MRTAKLLVSKNEQLQKKLVNILFSMKNTKGAIKVIKDFELNPGEFPKVIDQANFNTANYFVSNALRKYDHPNYMPLHKVEDIF